MHSETFSSLPILLLSPGTMEWMFISPTKFICCNLFLQHNGCWRCLWEMTRSRGWYSFEWEECPYKRDPREVLPLLPCDVPAKRWLSVSQELGSHRWVCQQLNLGLELSHSAVSDSMQPHGPQHARLSRPSPTPRACSNSLSWWCHPTISSSVVPFSSCLQSFPAPGSFFTSGGQSTGTSASASVIPKNIQDWFPLGWTGWISLQSKGVFSNTTVQKHQFFSTQLSLWSNSHIHRWLLEKQ